jgi:hypothetical protein
VIHRWNGPVRGGFWGCHGHRDHHDDRPNNGIVHWDLRWIVYDPRTQLAGVSRPDGGCSVLSAPARHHVAMTADSINYLSDMQVQRRDRYRWSDLGCNVGGLPSASPTGCLTCLLRQNALGLSPSGLAIGSG